MSNPWTVFNELMNQGVKWIAIIDSLNSNSNSYLVGIPNTSKIVQVTGPPTGYSIGDYVFIEKGVITGKAPELRTITDGIVS